MPRVSEVDLGGGERGDLGICIFSKSSQEILMLLAQEVDFEKH